MLDALMTGSLILTSCAQSVFSAVCFLRVTWRPLREFESQFLVITKGV
jgi:hypothetical protein